MDSSDLQRVMLCSFACLLTELLIGPTVQAQQLAPDFGVTATFSIVAVDPETGECGAAVASKYPAVGKVVPYVRAGVGAFCTQHWHNPEWGERALDQLEAGQSSEQVLAMLLEGDRRRDQRQLAIIDMRGRAANRNPSAAPPSSRYWGAMSGRFYACQGNTLAGREVITAMAQSFEETDGSLTDRLVAALVAADCAGGDHRGRLAAGVRVAKTGHEGMWFELYVDKSDDAVMDLFSKYVAATHEAKGSWTYEGMEPPCRNEESEMAESAPTTTPPAVLDSPKTLDASNADAANAVTHAVAETRCCPPVAPATCPTALPTACPIPPRSLNRCRIRTFRWHLPIR